jgi:hypothetical protein
MTMKNCINYFQLDAKQEAAFNISYSSFMLSYLVDSTIVIFGDDKRKTRARQALIEKED